MANKILPYASKSYTDWGFALYSLKKYDEAIEKYKIAAKIEPNYAIAYNNWGNALYSLKTYDEAIAKYKIATKIEPNDAKAYNNWGFTLSKLRKYNEAIVPLKRAIRLQPRHPNPHGVLGNVYLELGKFQKAITSFETLRKLLPPTHPFYRHAQSGIVQCQLWLDREEKLPVVLAGTKKVSIQEHVALVTLCVLFRKRYRDAVKLFSDLFKREPKLADDLKEQHRYNAACAAALAASGKGVHAKKIERNQRATLHKLGRGWLRADLKAYHKLWKQSPSDTILAQDRLSYWLKDSDLSSVRNEDAISKLPKAEQPAWRKLWADVKSLQKTIRASYTETESKGRLTSKSPQAFGCHYQEHKIQLKADRQYTIEVRSQQFNSFLIVLDPKGQRRLAQNDDIVPKKNLNSRVSLRVPKTGTYVVRVTTAQGRQVGAYSLHVFDHGPVKVKTGSLTAQETESEYTLKMKAGHTYIIKMQSQQFDTFLRLLDSNGKKLDENDDIDTKTNNLNSWIVYTPNQTDTYRIVATSFQGRGRGEYEIVIREFMANESKDKSN
ncbi:MAG: tetratricopeptide repeat protein [Gemmataceae bacterium]